jgi:transcriptional regulator with XRE-family HTH domain
VALTERKREIERKFRERKDRQTGRVSAFTEPVYIEIGARMRWLRQQRDWDLISAAERIGIHKSTLTAWELARGRVSIAELVRVAHVYGAPLEMFLADLRVEDCAAERDETRFAQATNREAQKDRGRQTGARLGQVQKEEEIGWTRAMANKTRKQYLEAERKLYVRRFYEARETDPKLTARSFANTIGVNNTVLSTWLIRYSHLYGGDSRSKSHLTPDKREAVLEVMKKEKPMSEIAKSRGVTLPTLQGWAMRYGDRIRTEMGISTPSEPSESDTSKTMVSSGQPPSATLSKYGKKMGRPTNAEMAARKDAWREQAGLAKAPAEPEGRAFLDRSERTERQREFPFTAEPVQREEPRPEARPEPAPFPAQSAADFQREITARALRERDAVLTTLEIMMREGRLPGQR